MAILRGAAAAVFCCERCRRSREATGDTPQHCGRKDVSVKIENCHGEYGSTLNWSGGTIYGSQKWSGTIFGCRKWSPRTNYACHKRSPPAITGPGRTIRGNKIIVKKGSGTIFCCRLIRRSRNILAIYELPSRNEDRMEFRYKHWCCRAERGRTCAPPCRRYSGTAVGFYGGREGHSRPPPVRRAPAARLSPACHAPVARSSRACARRPPAARLSPACRAPVVRLSPACRALVARLSRDRRATMS